MKRLNLISCVRTALEVRGISTVAVVNAVNAELGRLEKLSSQQKLGTGSVTKKAYKVTNTVTEKFTGAITAPLHFDAWHCKLEAANKLAEIPTIEIPTLYTPWLEKMVEVQGPTQEQPAV